MDLATLLSWAYALLFSAGCEWFSWLHAPSDEPQVGSRPEQALLAFAVVALSCHLSSYFLSSVLIGFAGGLVLLVFAAVCCRQYGMRAGGCMGLSGWWSLGFVAVTAFIFGPL